MAGFNTGDTVRLKTDYGAYRKGFIGHVIYYTNGQTIYEFYMRNKLFTTITSTASWSTWPAQYFRPWRIILTEKV